jgi:polyphosphate kinase
MSFEQLSVGSLHFCARHGERVRPITLKSRRNPALPILSFKPPTRGHILTSMSDKPPKTGPAHLLNRELSWLEFNQRVLEEALDPSTPLLERVKFFCLFSANLDEFFETRVAGLKQQIESAGRRAKPGWPDRHGNISGHPPQGPRWSRANMPAGGRNCGRPWPKTGFAFPGISRNFPRPIWPGWTNFYRAQVRPVLTPLGLDPAHPFPKLLNKSLNTIVQLEITEGGQRRRRLAVVQVPRVLPRLVKLPRADSRQQHYVFLGELIGALSGGTFSRRGILGCWHFRVTRNGELYADEEAAADPAQSGRSRPARPPPGRGRPAGSRAGLSAGNSRAACWKTSAWTKKICYY